MKPTLDEAHQSKVLLKFHSQKFPDYMATNCTNGGFLKAICPTILLLLSSYVNIQDE